MTRPPRETTNPVHIVLCVEWGVGNLRTPRAARILRQCLIGGKDRFGLKIIQFSVQEHAIHLIVEGHHPDSLTRGLKGLGVRIARRMNKAIGRRGVVIVERYRMVELRTPRQVRNALASVLNHAQYLPDGPRSFDVYSSAAYFDGWVIKCPLPPSRDPPVVRASLALLTERWRVHGLIAPDICAS